LISLILTASSDADALARLLSALVPGAAEGLVREVAVLGAQGVCGDIADEAGADLYSADAFADALARARGPWLLGLPVTAVFEPQWIAALGFHLAREPARPARLVASGLGLPGFGLTGRPEGWLVPKSLAPSAAARPCEQDLQRLARWGGQRLRVLRRA
jgi:hypothetical protein